MFLHHLLQGSRVTGAMVCGFIEPTLVGKLLLGVVAVQLAKVACSYAWNLSMSRDCPDTESSTRIPFRALNLFYLHSDITQMPCKKHAVKSRIKNAEKARNAKAQRACGAFRMPLQF